ncbi:DUF6049 family protein [Actinocorallia sp. API 0066]|nr:DUF6049 family protein [Actinocorallia sp. API 0066]
MLIVGAGFAPVAAAPAHAQKVRKDAVSVVLESVTPSVLGPKHKKVTIKGKVTNTGPADVSGVQLTAFSGARFTTRSQLAEFAAGTGEGTATTPLNTSRAFDLPAGGSQSFTLSGDAVRLASNDLSVYPIAVRATNAGGGLGSARTFVNYVPKDAKKTIKPTRVAFVWPLIDAQHRTTDESFVDDSLALSLDPDARGNRLHTLVDALGSGSPAVTLAIDPALVTDVDAMKSPYQVEGEERPANQDAGKWLERLRTYVKQDGNQFFLTPYADVDSVSLVNRKLSGLVKAAYADKKLGTEVLGAAEKYPRLAWPANGTINQATLDRLVRNGSQGSSTFLLSSDQLQPAGGLSHTPSAAHLVETSSGKRKPALAFDETIQQVISADTRSVSGALAARQRYLAETALMTAEAPGTSRTLIVAPERRWNPSADFAEFLLAHRDARSAWLQPTTLGQVGAPKNRTNERQLVTYPDAANEFSRTYVDGVKGMVNKANAFAGLFPKEPDYRLLRAPMRTSSIYWRGGGKRLKAAYSFKAKAERAVTQSVSKINLASEEVKQLAGSSGVLKFTAVNELTEGQVRIQIRIASTPPGRLVFPEARDPDVFVSTRPIEAGQKDTFLVAVKLPTGSSFNNKIPVKVQILNEAGQEINSSTVDVNTTGVSAVGLFITIGALAVLVVGVGFRGMRARRRRKEEEARDHGAAAG